MFVNPGDNDTYWTECGLLLLQLIQSCLLVWFGIFCMPNFQHTILQQQKLKNYGHKYLWTRFVVRLFSSPAYAQFWVLGACVCLATSRCLSVNFYIALCAVSALNSSVIQSEACISDAKYEQWPFFSGNHVEIIFRLFSLRTKWNWKELMEKVPKQWKNNCSCRDTNQWTGIVESSVSKLA